MNNKTGIVVFLLSIVIIGIVGAILLTAGGRHIATMLETKLLQAQAASFQGQAEMYRNEAEKSQAHADELRAQGERELKQAEGEALTRSVATSNFVVGYWGTFMPLLPIVWFAIGYVSGLGTLIVGAWAAVLAWRYNEQHLA
jgi:ABC-type transport system involved in cytochrome bd biosynthesis fused ATPase/permease subunit